MLIEMEYYKCSHRVALEGGTPRQNYFSQYLLSEDHELLEDYKIILLMELILQIHLGGNFS